MKSDGVRILLLVLTLWIACTGAGSVSAADPLVYTVKAVGAVSPGMSGFLQESIEKASEDRVACLVIQLDTPGGLVNSMRAIVQDILASEVPVVVYVAPPGARAASAGVLLTLAGDIAAMAPGTNIGAAHPVGIGGGEMDDVMSKKVVNDMAAYARTIAERRGRNPEWAEEAVRESVSVTENEALQAGVIDLIAEDLEDLLTKIDGREIEGKGTLNTRDARVVLLAEDFRNRILRIISDPNIAYILMMIGIAGLYFELSHPGAIFPGVIGGICIILAFFAFQTLPVNYVGLLLILIAIILFFMELKITSFGLLTIGGIACLLLGSIMLFESDIPGLRLSWSVLLATVGVVTVFFVIVAGLVVQAQKAIPRTGAEGLVGEVGMVKRALEPKGMVLVHGELWQAVSEGTILPETHVRIIGVEGLLLKVEPFEATIVQKTI